MIEKRHAGNLSPPLRCVPPYLLPHLKCYNNFEYLIGNIFVNPSERRDEQ